MEDHPQYQQALDELAQRGFKVIKTAEDPHVTIRRVVDSEGNIIRTDREIYLRDGMRFLDLEHEIGHVNQFADPARFPDGPPPTEIAIERPGKPLSQARDQGGVLTNWQNSIVEYHNRLQEVVALAERGASPEILNEHLAGVDHWSGEYWDRGLKGGRSSSRRAWADEHFPDIDDLAAKVAEIRRQLQTGRGDSGSTSPGKSS